MLKAYKLKIYANQEKNKKILSLLNQWTIDVQLLIDLYWQLEKVDGSFPPNELMPSGTLRRNAAVKVWQIVKGARATNQTKTPQFNGKVMDLTELNFKILDLKTKAFDLWFKLSTLEKGKRITIPCKRHSPFVKAISKGTLRKSAKILVNNYSAYLLLYVELPEKKSENTQKIGIDLGLKNSVVTSDGVFLGQSVQEVRRRTKHRKYLQGYSAQKQEWFRVAKQLASDYQQTDFVVEDLFFKGREERSKSFRRKYNTWAYKTLARKLESLGQTEGFKVIRVNPAYTSQSCPACFFIDKGNRKGEDFKCLQCAHTEHADVVGAKNILGLSDRLPRVLSTRKEIVYST